VFKSPLELVTEILVPTLRAMEAKRLRQLGMSQNKIAVLLGVTQPAVKQYLDESEDLLYSKLENLGLTRSEIEDFLQNITELLIKGDQKAVMSYITVFGLSALSSLKFCEYHKKIDSSIPRDCEVCKGLYKEDEEELLNIAVLMLENKIITPLIPEVLSNIAFAKRNAKSEKDVIAIPGRITKVFGVPKAVSKPTWGGSKHLALVLLHVMKVSPETRAVMNIRFDEKIEKLLRELGFKFAIIGPSSEVDDLSIARLIASAYQENMDAVIHLGGKGLEANTYIFGKDPIEVAKKVLEIAKRYHKDESSSL